MSIAASGDWDEQRVADRIGKSPRWVARRASLRKLIPDLTKLATTATHPLHRAQTDVLEGLSRLPRETQQRLHDEFFTKAARRRRCDVDDELPHHFGSRERLNRYLDDQLRNLKKAKWKLDDDTLDVKAGACSSCSKRSSHQPGLFEIRGRARIREEHTDKAGNTRSVSVMT